MKKQSSILLTMSGIHTLDEESINRIAAGEVVERPASVVKELVENALDAGAGSVEILISSGGKTLIEVRDNGSGMSRPDLEICTLRYTTSKLRNATELSAVNTNGFRGEALSSIAAVSRISIETRSKKEKSALLLETEAGEILDLQECARNRGSTIRVHDLFFNTPVRRKFLASDQAETNRIVDICTRLALANPETAFRLIQNDRDLLACRAGSSEQRMAEILGPSRFRNCKNIKWHSGEVSLSGCVGLAEGIRSAKGRQYLFVNRRPLWNPMLTRALTRGFESVYPGKKPVAVIFLDLPCGEVDVNVHPSKREVRFSSDDSVFSAVYHAVKSTLQEPADNLPSFPLKTEGDRSGFSSHVSVPVVPRENSRIQDLFTQPETGKVISLQSTITPVHSEIFQSDAPSVSYLQIDKCFILCETSSGLLIVDQNAAHERILYEKALRILEEGREMNTQQLLFPELLEFSREDYLLLESCLDEFRRLAFDLEPFGGNCMNLRGIPTFLQNSQATTAVHRTLERLRSEKDSGLPQVLARAWAGGSAMHKGQGLGQEEMAALLDQLFATTEPHTSPTGRAAIFRFSLDDLRKQFGR